MLYADISFKYRGAIFKSNLLGHEVLPQRKGDVAEVVTVTSGRHCWDCGEYSQNCHIICGELSELIR